MSKKLVLIDGHSILNRAFYGVPDLTNSEGIHTNAIYGFLNILFKILEEEHPDYLTVAFDLSAPTFRHKMYEPYKGTRKPMPIELKQQVPLMKEMLTAMGITIVSLEGYEADDLLGTIAKRTEAKGIEVSVVSGDRDLLQLATDNIKIRIPKTKKGVTEIEDYNTAQVVDLYGVTPIEFIDVKALMGDASDNIPGAPGIGEKTASALIMNYHSIENAFAHIDEVKPPKAKKSLEENYEQVVLSKTLATIDIDAPIEYDLDDSKADGYFTSEAYELCKRYNFKSILKKFDSQTINEVHKPNQAEENYIIIDDKKQVDNEFEAATNSSLCAFKIMFEDGRMFGVALKYIDGNDGVYIPVRANLTEEYIAEKIMNLLLNAKGIVVALNLKEQLPYIAQIDSKVWFDSLKDRLVDAGLAAYLLNPAKEGYSYDELSRDYNDTILPSKSEILIKLSMAEAAFTDESQLMRIACMETSVLVKAWDKIKDGLVNEEMYKLFVEIEMPLLFVLNSMEREGVRVDRSTLVHFGDELAVRIAQIEKEIYEMAGEEFNINSPKQLGVILFEKLQMPNGKKTKSGYSTAADVLEKLAIDYPIVSTILEYRQLTKLKSTYADGLLKFIGNDERIHCHFNQTITQTGRISCTDPNLQNIPIRMELGREIRKAFVPKDGCIFIDADYSQIELRILAHMSGDDNLIAAYNSGDDIHKITASQVFHIPLNEVTKEQRSNAKAVNFGIIYGISSFGLSQDLSITRKEAKEYIEQYFEAYPTIKNYIDGLVASAKKKGYSVTMFDRRRTIPELASSNFMQRSFGERIAMNSPIQGTAADIIKIAMINVSKALQDMNLKSKLILQVHDELLIETYEDEVDTVKQLLIDNMKKAANLKVALEVGVESGKNWFEAH